MLTINYLWKVKDNPLYFFWKFPKQKPFHAFRIGAQIHVSIISNKLFTLSVKER